MLPIPPRARLGAPRQGGAGLRRRLPSALPGGLPGLLVAIAVLGAAVGGPWRTSARVPGFGTWHISTGSRPLPLPPPPPRGMPRIRPVAHHSSLVAVILMALLAALVAIGLLILAVALVRQIRILVARRTWSEPAVAQLPAPEVDIERVRAGVEQAESVLDDEFRIPRDAVVFAWVELEAAAAASGVPRDPAWTPSEFVVQVLRRTGAPPGAVRRLLAAYLHARFSDEPVTAADRDVARDSLGSIRRTIGTTVAAR